jgi:hypothetical protein
MAAASSGWWIPPEQGFDPGLEHWRKEANSGGLMNESAAEIVCTVRQPVSIY